MKILISSPRHGSTYLNAYFSEFNLKENPNSIFPTPTGNYEFLLNSNHTNKWWPLDINQKIKYIESCRENGSELLYKIHAFHLFYEDWILDWFYNFYEDAEIYVLKRKDLWRAFLSILVHHQKGRWLWHNDGTRDEELISKCSKLKFKHDKNVMNYFFHHYECLNKIKGNTLFLEDITHEKITSLLKINIDEPYKKWNVDYEEFFESKELSIIRREFRIISEQVHTGTWNMPK